jgi:phosphoribosylformylglycinamidine cyclo-ligase
LSRWQLPPVFGWLAEQAGLSDDEMLRTFNCGVGLIAVVEAACADDVIAAFNGCGERAFRIGTLVPGITSESDVQYRQMLTPQ